MTAAPRRLEPELLDDLAPDEPRAARARRDLQRVHYAMGSLSILRRAVARLRLAASPRRILELGAGDATLLLRLCRTLHPRWADVEITVLDRHDLVAPKTREAYRQLDWNVTVMREDALTWARQPTTQHYDLCVTTLFLHHLNAAGLEVLMPAIADRSNAFIACEPRRDGLSRLGSRLVCLLGANEVTREDAVKSVAAGFTGRELTAAWPQVNDDWVVEEFPALPFTHCFTAIRARDREEVVSHAN
jgi:hypothetical protein